MDERTKRLMPWMMADFFMIAFAATLLLTIVGGVSLLAIRSGDDVSLPAALSASLDAGDERETEQLKSRLQEFEKLNTQAAKDIANLNDSLRTSEERNALAQKVVDNAGRELEKTKANRDHLSKQLAALKQNFNTEVELAVSKSSSKETTVRQELLGFRGSFEKVVFVIDTSSSMGKLRRPRTSSKESQAISLWPEVVSRASQYLDYLPVKKFRIICFDSEVRELGADWHEQSERWKAKEFLSQSVPSGYTLTEAALIRALSHRPTSILLITDGTPSDKQGKSDLNQQKRLKLLASETQTPPINVVAVGDFLNEEAYELLREISSRSGGGFVAY